MKPTESSAEPVEPENDSIVAAVPSEQTQELKQDPSHESESGNGRALAPIDDLSSKKNGIDQPEPENNNSPANVAEAEGQQKVT